MQWQMPLRDLDWVFLILKHVHCIIQPTPMTIFLVLCVSAVRWWKSFLVLVCSHWRCKITVFATNHTFPNPWPWINNCIEQWSERVFLFNWVTLPFNWSGGKTWNNSVQHRWTHSNKAKHGSDHVSRYRENVVNNGCTFTNSLRSDEVHVFDWYLMPT